MTAMINTVIFDMDGLMFDTETLILMYLKMFVKNMVTLFQENIF